jgi:hypothetical protein
MEVPTNMVPAECKPYISLASQYLLAVNLEDTREVAQVCDRALRLAMRRVDVKD